MPKSSPPAKLRVKTGCQTCRRRKKKCDESRPICQRCAALGWHCSWPTLGELIDRRQSMVLHEEPIPRIKDEPETEEQHALEEVRVCLISASTAHRALYRDITSLISKHFLDKYYNLILLPNCGLDYYWDSLNELQRLAPTCKSLQYSILSSAAAHLYSIDKSAQMQELALTYYSHALRDLQQLLQTNLQVETHDGLLMSVVLLYTLGSTGEITYDDTPRHINAAVRLVTLRLFKTHTVLSRSWDRLILESVVFAVFVHTIRLWSDEFHPDDAYDPAFWLQAEHLLDQDGTCQVLALDFNSPVVVIPVQLLKHLLLIREVRLDPLKAGVEVLRELKLQVSIWEGFATSGFDVESLGDDNDDEQQRAQKQMAQDAFGLYVIIASILMEQMLQGDTGTNTPSAHDPDSWQVRHVRTVLNKYRGDETWAKFFASNIAVYTIGFFMSRPEDIDLIRQDLQLRWDLTRFSHIYRYCNDLEATWEKRRGGANKATKEVRLPGCVCIKEDLEVFRCINDLSD